MWHEILDKATDLTLRILSFTKKEKRVEILYIPGRQISPGMKGFPWYPSAHVSQRRP